MKTTNTDSSFSTIDVTAESVNVKSRMTLNVTVDNPWFSGGVVINV